MPGLNGLPFFSTSHTGIGVGSLDSMATLSTWEYASLFLLFERKALEPLGDEFAAVRDSKAGEMMAAQFESWHLFSLGRHSGEGSNGGKDVDDLHVRG